MTKMSRQPVLENGKKYNHIVQSALQVFSIYGLSGASMDQIATTAQMSKSNIFYYFSSKEELYLATLSSVLTEWLVPFEALNAEHEPQQALSDYIQVKFEMSKKYPEASRVFALEIIQGAPHLKTVLKGPLKKSVKEKVKVMEQWIESGKMAKIDPVNLIFSIWAITQHYADFAAQIEMVTGNTLSNKKFFNQACQDIQTILLSGIIPDFKQKTVADVAADTLES